MDLLTLLNLNLVLRQILFQSDESHVHNPFPLRFEAQTTVFVCTKSYLKLSFWLPEIPLTGTNLIPLLVKIFKYLLDLLHSTTFSIRNRRKIIEAQVHDIHIIQQ